LARLAQGQSPLEVSGALVGTEEEVEVRADVRNTSDERLVGVRLGGDLLGRHAFGRLGDIEPGQTATALLAFPYASEWRPGRHVLPLSIDYAAAPGPVAPSLSLLAYLVLPLATPAEPALRIAAPPVSLDIRTRLPVRLESADGLPHRARVRVKTPPGLVAPAPPPVVDVPAQGGVTVEIALLHGAAPPGSRQGILIVAEALEGPIERMSVAISAVDIAPDPAWLGHLRAPILVVALVLLAAGGLAEWRGTRP
jgi:hypothetical protein